MKKPLPPGFSIPIEIVESVKTLTEAAKEYGIIVEQEKTKREQIKAYKEATIEKIQAQRALLSQYLKESFQERSTILQKQFELIDQALASNDLPLLDRSLGAIVAIVHHSPFKDIQDMHQKLADDSFVLRLE